MPEAKAVLKANLDKGSLIHSSYYLSLSNSPFLLDQRRRSEAKFLLRVCYFFGFKSDYSLYILAYTIMAVCTRQLSVSFEPLSPGMSFEITHVNSLV